MQHVKVLSTCVVHPDAVRSLLPALIILQAVRSPTSPYDIRHCSISTQNTILSASAARGHGQLLVASRPAGRQDGRPGWVRIVRNIEPARCPEARAWSWVVHHD